MPKQTVSRRLAELEAALGVQLAQRTTRRLRLTDVGRAYAVRCREVARLADEANRAAAAVAGDEPRGTLRITADPTFGEAFLPGLSAEFLARYGEVRLEVVLTNRYVDLVDEGFDLAFRVGRLEDSSLVARRLGPARLWCCAAPGYLERKGVPADPSALAEHDCIELSPRRGPSRWPFRDPEGGVQAVPVTGRIQVDSLPMARQIARAGLGIANLPAFACEADVEAGTLSTVLDEWTIDVGGVFVVYPPQRFLAARVRRFVDLAVERFGERADRGRPDRPGVSASGTRRSSGEDRDRHR
jgi:DNA-binding transcriptional LysR family regulator